MFIRLDQFTCLFLQEHSPCIQERVEHIPAALTLSFQVYFCQSNIPLPHIFKVSLCVLFVSQKVLQNFLTK